MSRLTKASSICYSAECPLADCTPGSSRPCQCSAVLTSQQTTDGHWLPWSLCEMVSPKVLRVEGVVSDCWYLPFEGSPGNMGKKKQSLNYYFAHCCEKLANKKPVEGGRSCLLYDSEDTVHIAWEVMAASCIHNQEMERDECWCVRASSCSCSSRLLSTF